MNMNESRHSLLCYYEVWIASRSFSVLSNSAELKKVGRTNQLTGTSFYTTESQGNINFSDIRHTAGMIKFDFRAYFIS